MMLSVKQLQRLKELMAKNSVAEYSPEESQDFVKLFTKDNFNWIIDIAIGHMEVVEYVDSLETDQPT